MLRISKSKSAAAAVDYFKNNLMKGDYYLGKDNSENGVWGGKLAPMLGLEGEVEAKDFEALCFNKNPQDGSRLTPLDRKDRIVGFDFVWSAPKSASIAGLYDKRVREAFKQSVEETMKELEGDAAFQDHSGKKKSTKSEKLLWSTFVHNTTRPLDDGVPDVHLHAHAYTMNVTYDEKRKKFIALDNSLIHRKASYFEAACDARFAKRLNDMGYAIERRGLSWEIAGIDNVTNKKFSRRTTQIEKEAAKEEAKSGKLSARQKALLGAKTRAKKPENEQSWQELVTIWKDRLDEGEVKRIERAALQGASKQVKVSAGQALQMAEDHLWERKSAVLDYALKREILLRSFGSLIPEKVHEAVKHAPYIRKETRGKTWLTTKQALEEEKRLLAFVRRGRGIRKPLNAEYEIQNEILSDEQ